MRAGIQKRKKYSDSGIKFIQENFDSEAIKAELQDLYIDAIRNRNLRIGLILYKTPAKSEQF